VRGLYRPLAVLALEAVPGKFVDEFGPVPEVDTPVSEAELLALCTLSGQRQLVVLASDTPQQLALYLL
jgi:hypothetical protein